MTRTQTLAVLVLAVIVSLATTLLATTLLATGSRATPVEPAGATTHFSGLESSGTITADGSLVAKSIIMSPSQTISVTNGATLTPAASLISLQSAGTVGAQIAACTVPGTLLRLYNSVAQSITISDTGKANLTGDITLGQYDTLTLICAGDTWYEIAASNN